MAEKQTLRIVSDGTAMGTRVLDAEGRPIENIIAVQWYVTAGFEVTARITIVNVPVDVIGTVDGA